MEEKRKDDQLTVRIGGKVKGALRREAREQHRSLGAQIRLIVERVMALPEPDRKALLNPEVRA